MATEHKIEKNVDYFPFLTFRLFEKLKHHIVFSMYTKDMTNVLNVLKVSLNHSFWNDSNDEIN